MSGAFLFATPQEAAPLVAALGARALGGVDSGCWRAGEWLVAVSGMGLDSARAAVGHLAGRHLLRRIVNLGIAGSLTDSLAVGEVVEVAEVISDSASAPPLATAPFAMTAAPRVARLLSRDVAVFDPALRARLSANADLVDMEGYAVAEACIAHGLDCVLLKSISDDATDRAMLHANLERASSDLARWVLTRLEALK